MGNLPDSPQPGATGCTDKWGHLERASGTVAERPLPDTQQDRYQRTEYEQCVHSGEPWAISFASQCHRGKVREYKRVHDPDAALARDLKSPAKLKVFWKTVIRAAESRL